MKQEKDYKEREKKDMNLLEILDLDLIDLEMKASNKDEVLYQLSSMLYKKKNIKNLDKFLEAVYERESIGETGLGGIAIPHGLTEQVINASVAIGKVEKPIEWESLDDQPVSLIFLLAAPTGDQQKIHLQNLSQLASVVAHKEHVDALMKCNTKEEFFQLFETYFNEFTKRKEG
nr:PTS sugar transporter subunit IIA [uncultured Anaerostipes sp.]